SCRRCGAGWERRAPSSGAILRRGGQSKLGGNPGEFWRECGFFGPARVRARSGGREGVDVTKPSVVLFADCELDLSAFELRREGALRPIEPQVFVLLVYLIRN